MKATDFLNKVTSSVEEKLSAEKEVARLGKTSVYFLTLFCLGMIFDLISHIAFLLFWDGKVNKLTVTGVSIIFFMIGWALAQKILNKKIKKYSCRVKELAKFLNGKKEKAIESGISAIKECVEAGKFDEAAEISRKLAIIKQA